MPAKLWNGTISFGLVAIPVSMIAASRESRVAFHLLHDADNARLVRQMRCSADGEVMEPEDLIRGVEVEPGRFVVVTEQELEGLAVERSATIEIDRFVDEEAVPALFLARPYYLLPDGAVKPYRLLVNALKERRRMGIATFVMHTREHLVGIRAMDQLLCLEMLRFEEEIRSPDEIRPAEIELSPADIEAMTELIDQMTGPFLPPMLIDDYQLRVREYLHKRQLEGTVSAPQVEKEGEEEYVDLMAALEESMARARARRGHAA
jgi:DNA end-binding protein Ku